MALYSMSVDGIALVAATAKSIAELGFSSTNRGRIVSWSVTFDGVTASAVPVKIEVGRFSAGVTTATTFTVDKLDPADGTQTVTAKHSTTTEGAGTADDVEIYRVPPTGGFVMQFPLGREWVMPVSTFWRIRCTAAAGVNATFCVTWEE
jgi:hypothetical protein